MAFLTLDWQIFRCKDDEVNVDQRKSLGSVTTSQVCKIAPWEKTVLWTSSQWGRTLSRGNLSEQLSPPPPSSFASCSVFSKDFLVLKQQLPPPTTASGLGPPGSAQNNSYSPLLGTSLWLPCTLPLQPALY